jgi:hypothetical protein
VDLKGGQRLRARELPFRRSKGKRMGGGFSKLGFGGPFCSPRTGCPPQGQTGGSRRGAPEVRACPSKIESNRDSGGGRKRSRSGAPQLTHRSKACHRRPGGPWVSPAAPFADTMPMPNSPTAFARLRNFQWPERGTFPFSRSGQIPPTALNPGSASARNIFECHWPAGLGAAGRAEPDHAPRRAADGGSPRFPLHGKFSRSGTAKPGAKSP